MPGGRGWIALFWLLVPAARAQQPAPTRSARVTYLSRSSVFIDAGSAEGLRPGSRADVVRRGRTIAVLRVESLGLHQASCAVVNRQLPLTVGDSVRFLVAAPAAAARPPLTVPPPTPVAPTAVPRAVTAAAPQDTARPAPRQAVPAPRPADTTSRVAVRPAIPTPVTPAPPARVIAPLAPPPVASPPPQPAAPVPAGAWSTARVTFLTTSSVYVNAGKAQGLALGRRVDVVRGGRAVAELTVAFLSSHQASCQVVSKADSLMVGDTVRFLPVAAARDTAATAVARAATRPAARGAFRSGSGVIRGRVGLYYLTVQQRDSFGGRFTQPSGDVRLQGVGLGGSPVGLMLDVRSRRVVQSLPGSATNTTSQTRVYQASVQWQAPGSPLRFTTGRQYAPGITSVGLVDGASAEAALAGWDYGLFAGTQPELVNLGFSSDIAQLGGYLRRHNRPESLRRWSMTLGASGSYFNGHTNREFAYLQGSYVTRRVSVYAVQEVDYYRRWRRVNGEQAISPTSSFANLQLQLTGGFSLTGGVDNRRSVRLYRDVVNPATEFDDTFRRGVWVGFTARFAGHFRAAFDARTNNGGSSGRADMYTLALGAERLTPLGASVRSRSTFYRTGGGGREGWLNSISLGLEPFGRGSVQLTSGWRAEHDSTTAPTLNVRWTSVDLDVSLVRSIFVIVSAYRERGGIEAHDLVYGGLSYRF